MKWTVRTDTMITRTLLVAAWCVCASALTPLSAAGDDNDCALYLSGPGRSSAFDYSLNLLRGNFGYEGQHTCITYDAVNQAYLDARKRILVSQPKGDWKPEDYASVGELVLDISISLAKTYGLTYEEIEKGLPLIDTSRTLIREVCPPVFSHVECRAGKYRRLDGLCNNLEHPTWGATNAPFQRLIGPLFADGINSPRISHTGRDLPLSRVVSRTMHPDEGFHDHAGTVMVIAWGQFMDHDYTLTGTPLDPRNRNDPEECCNRPPHLKHPYCNEIRIPDDDYFYRLFGVKCIDFVRAFPSPRPGCRLGSRVPYNTLTGAIDGNTVYGVTDKFARKLRTGYGGLLRMNPVFKEYGLKDLLPLKLDIPDEGCTRPNKNMYCFEAGEIRVNEQLVLTVMHTLMAREHNRVAKGLAEVNPHWDDETLFQEARRINIAEIQHITYNEFLPILLGKDVMEKFGLVLEKEGYWDGYDNTVNPDVIASFASAAYRFGHSLLPTAVERWSKAHKFIASKRLSDLIRRPYDLYRAGVLDEYVMGLMNQVAQAMDDSITQEVTNHLFKKVGARFGMDLVSFNMQRGREFGIPGYMEFRKFCGLSGADTFQDLFGSMPNETVRKYETIFQHPIDVDLWSGGVSERPLPGSMLGPTFACIIATQFSYSRRGDRFWFELPNQPSSFTPEQLTEIRKARLARVICDNTDIIDTVQLYPMVLPDHELNPRVPCRSGIIPSMDFTKWAEPAPFQGAAKQFITDAVITPNEVKATSTEPSVNVTDINITNNNVSENINTTSKSITAENAKDNTNMTSNTEKPLLNNSSRDTSGTDCKAIGNCPESVPSELKSKDSIMKYVTGKNNEESSQKSKGHIKNTLKRRKRALKPNNQFLDADRGAAPEILNYETQHTKSLPLVQHKPGNIIKSNLADFNIETVHEPQNPSSVNEEVRTIENSPRKQSDSKSEAEDESSENSESDTNQRRPSDSEPNSNESDEIEDNKEEKVSSYNREPPAKNSESSEDENNTFKQPLKSSTINESQESTENSGENVDRSRYSEPRSKANESDEVKDDGSNENESQRLTIPGKDKESAEENNDNNHEGPSKPNAKSFQDVDLDDFSYEKIQVNKKGEIEADKGSNDSEENDSSDENTSNEKEKLRSDYIEKGNNGEIKPVVELNSESNEFSQENNDSEKSRKENLNAKHESLETLLGVKESDSEEQNEKIVANNEEAPSKKGNGNVKQQFEIIPLNYKHDNKKNKEDKEETEKESQNDGTLNTLLPNSERFDDNLNFKFDDVSVKLPEIKLPDDILSYTYDDDPYAKNQKQKEKKKEQNDRFYHYSDEDSNENPLKNVPEHDDDDKDYYGYGKSTERKQDYKKKGEQETEEDEDLYEKFVRERFGKRGSFQKRSEALREEVFTPSNPNLANTIQQILKKTQDTQKQAEKSGDPNAGYMWTLEYGGKV